jgi:branched-chain amino acid transport system substrate-binding protein
VPNVANGPIIGTQWVKAPAGSKFKLDFLVTEHVNDPNVPIGVKLRPYNS